MLDGLVIDVGAAVAGPREAKRLKFRGDLAGARKVRGEGIVIEEELLHLREKFFGVGHFCGDILGGANAVFVTADGLRPKAERALRGAATAGVQRDVRVFEIADGISFDLEVALIDIGDPRQRVHVMDKFTFGIMKDFAVLAIGESGNFSERTAFGNFLARKIKFLAPNPVNRGRRLQGFRGQHRGLRANEANGRAGLLLVYGLGHCAVVFQRRG